MRNPLPLLLLACLAVACGGGRAGEPAEAGNGVAVKRPPSPEAMLAGGFLVWESDRSGSWRIWIRSLEGGEPRQLTPETPDRAQCCPHVSPDGRWIAYATVNPRPQGYPPAGTGGQLRLIRPDGSDDHLLKARIRTYFEHRAVVWQSPSELIYLDGQRYTAQIDLETRRARRLTREAGEPRGRLIDRRLRWAATGVEGFYRFDRRRRVFEPELMLTGCQFYFSHDGRFGFWVAGAGGPIHRVSFKDREIVPLLRKNDPRVPDDFGYLYFPMLSRDGRLLAFAGSRNEHPHFGTDYEIFVAVTDPRTLQLTAPPRRFTHHPATDRYPDVHLERLPLGRHSGEAPFAIRLRPPREADWQWSWGDGARSSGRVGEHVYTAPGRYAIEARDGDRRLAALVAVEPPRPPRVVEAATAGDGRQIVLRFDEPVDLERAALELGSGAGIVERQLEGDGRRLRLHLSRRLAGGDRLRIEGVRDRAQRANTLEPLELEIAAPEWPARRDGLQFVWRSRAPGDATPALEARAGARWDDTSRLRPSGGHFAAVAGFAPAIQRAAQWTNEITLEAVLAPDPGPGPAPGTILALGGRQLDLALEQSGERLVFALRVDRPGRPGDVQRVDLFELPPDRDSHVVVTYTPTLLAAYLDGRERASSHHLAPDFFRWRSHELVFGGGLGGAWRGTLERVAIYARRLEADEVAENALRSRGGGR